MKKAGDKPKRKYTRKPVFTTQTTGTGGPLVTVQAPPLTEPVVMQPPRQIVDSSPVLPIKPLNPDIIAKLVLHGDLSGLTPQETTEYYVKFCEHLGLDPVTRPFDILSLQGKKVLYAHKGCTDQLRKKYGVSVTDLRGEMLGDCYRVTALGKEHTGRTDAATGVVKVSGLTGDAFANATMKAETKAKRRLTLSLCGLGMLDETELETIPGATTVSIDISTPPSNGKETPKTAPPKAEPVYDISGSQVLDSRSGPPYQDPKAEKWQEVGKAPQGYWARKGNPEGQQFELIHAFGDGRFKVEKNAEGKWVAFKLVPPISAEDEAQQTKLWSPELETT